MPVQTGQKFAGEALRDMRTRMGRKMDDIERETGGIVSQQQLSKLERGAVQRPSMEALVALGKVYDKSPNQMAQLYGYWEPGAAEAPDDPRIQLLLSLLKRLPDAQRERLLNMIDFATTPYEQLVIERGLVGAIYTTEDVK